MARTMRQADGSDGPVSGVQGAGQQPWGRCRKSNTPREERARCGVSSQEGYGINVAPVSFIDQPTGLQ